MGGGRKKQLCSDRGTRRRYFASGGAGGKKDAGSRSYSSDRRLIPRIKEYLAEYGSGVVDVGEMALALQDQHSEYTRKKRVAFRNLVAKVYKSLQEGASEEGRLQRREMEHLKRRADSAHQTAEEGVEISDSECSFSDLTSDSDAEFEANLPEISNMMNYSLLHMYGSNATPAADSQDSRSHSQSHSNGESPFQDGTDSASVVNLSSGTLVSELQRATNSGTTADEKDEVAGSFFMDTSGDLDDKRRRKLPSPAYDSTVRETSSNHSSYEERSRDGNSPVQSTSECLNDSAALNGVVPGPRPPSGSGGDGGVPELASAAEKPPAKSPKRVTFAPDVAQFVGDSSIKTSGEESKSLAFKSVSVKRDRHGQERERRGKEREGRGREREGRGRKYREHGSKRRKMEKEESGRVREDKSMDSAVKASLGQKRNKEFAMEKSTVRFSDVGGCQSCLEEVCRLLLHLRHSEVFKHLGVKPPQGFLLHGPPGSGKTLLAQAIAGELDLPLLRLAATEVVSGVSGESEETIRSLFQQAKEHAPCVLFIDEIDAICPKRETAHREMERRIVTQLLSCLDDLNQSSADSHVLVIGATNRPDSLDPALRRAGRFDREISLGIPDEQARESILRVLCRPLRLEAGLDFVSLAHNTPGFVGADLLALVREASLSAVSRVIAELSAKAGVDGSSPESMEVNGQGEGSQTIPGGSPVGAASSSSSSSAIQQLQMAAPLTGEQLQAVCITTQDFKVALTLVQPSAKREGFATVPDTTWEDVGALEGVREELSMAILAPVHYPRQFASLGLATPPGILLAGPPGCGKTLLAKAIANESGINFISVKGPELLNMYVGESERAVRQVFQRARNSSPCVIFFDELDALCPKRSEMAETSASARVVNQLLTEMDGLEVRKQVFIMAATNRPDIIDPAVLRPGRLDKVLYVGLPSESDRAAILKTLTKGGKPQLHRDVDLDSLASDDYCEGFSGADLSALVREAAVLALQEYMKLQPLQKTASDQSNYSSIAEECVVSMKNFKAALQKVKPSVSEKEKAFYNQIAERFGR